MNAFMPAEDGWPYPDSAVEDVDFSAEADDDLLSIQNASPQLYSSLDPLERQVLGARFGIGGAPIRSVKQLCNDLHVPRSVVHHALGTGLTKIRLRLSS